jgi:hypothetical protein
MDDADRATLAQLGEEVTIYRGFVPGLRAAGWLPRAELDAEPV